MVESNFLLGELKNEQEHLIPLHLPLDNSGLGIFYNSSKTEVAINFIQSFCLYFLKNKGVSNTEIKIFDFSLQNNFKELSRLKSIGLVDIINETKAIQVFELLEEMIRHRLHNLLPDFDSFEHYNKESQIQEKYQLVLFNLVDVTKLFKSRKDLEGFIDAAKLAGIYIIIFSDEDKISRVKEDCKAQHKIVENLRLSYTNISFDNNRLLFSKQDHQLEKLKGLMNRFSLTPFFNTNVGTLKHYIDLIKQTLELEISENSSDFLKIPIGHQLDGSSSFNFSLGSSSGCYHAFIAGTNGTGKTTLLNNLILGIAEHYSAKQIKLYLMDYKHGVEFQHFSNHPNCERLFLDNANLDAAIDLIQEFSNEIDKRSSKFQLSKVSNIEDFNEVNEVEPLPRLVLIIDEVHRLFSGSWKEQQYFEEKLEYVVKQGRAFGIHVVLSTQTLSGSNISKAIMSQIPLRISFKLIGSEVWKIFASNNNEPTKLKKYQFIYNDDAGELQGNKLVKGLPPRDIEDALGQIRSGKNKNDMIYPHISKQADFDFKPKLETKKNVGKAQEKNNEIVFNKMDFSQEVELVKQLREGEVTQ